MHLTFNTAELYLTFEKAGIHLLLILMLPEPTVDQEHINNNVVSHFWNSY